MLMQQIRKNLQRRLKQRVFHYKYQEYLFPNLRCDFSHQERIRSNRLLPQYIQSRLNTMSRVRRYSQLSLLGSRRQTGFLRYRSSLRKNGDCEQDSPGLLNPQQCIYQDYYKVQEILDKNNGRIDIKSKVHEGTEVVITIPTK